MLPIFCTILPIHTQDCSGAMTGRRIIAAMETLLERMCDVVERHAVHFRQETPIPGLTLYRVNQPLPPAHVLYRPRMVVILRGSKTIAAGDAPFLADSSTFLLVTVDLPVCTQVFLDHESRSHLGFSLDIDRVALAEAMAKMPSAGNAAAKPAGVATSAMTTSLAEPFARLLDLLDTPGDIPFIAPLVMQEVYYRVLRGTVGDTLRQLALSGSHAAQIDRATQWIKANYAAPMAIDALAEATGMSVTSFYRHFKAMTLMTPVQYRTRLRLQEARRLLLADARSVGIAAAMVGYDSQSQFTRDYKRMFGAPPGADVARVAGAV